MRPAGVYTALVTPMSGAALDEAAFRRLVGRQIEAGVDGLVPCGTTGEAATLDVAEHARVIAWAVEEAAGRVPVLAGVGSNDTRTAVLNARRARDAGAQGVLATAPYYNKPTQAGLICHFLAVSAAVPELEVCLYDVPGRTGIRIEAATVAELARAPNINSIKDATADLAHAADLVSRLPADFALISGDDFTTMPFLAVGGAGCISVAANLVPGRMVQLVRAARAGQLAEARAMNAALQRLFRALFLQTNPLPVKAALASLGLCEEEYRLPLCSMDRAPRKQLFEMLESYEIQA